MSVNPPNDIGDATVVNQSSPPCHAPGRPDMRIVESGDFEALSDRFDGALTAMREIAKIPRKKG